jgi:hypothetical protein
MRVGVWSLTTKYIGVKLLVNQNKERTFKTKYLLFCYFRKKGGNNPPCQTWPNAREHCSTLLTPTMPIHPQQIELGTVNKKSSSAKNKDTPKSSKVKTVLFITSSKGGTTQRRNINIGTLST